MPLYQNIPTLPRAYYSVHIAWTSVEDTLKRYDERNISGFLGLDLNPDFQRDFVWTEEQETKYIEYTLMGGEIGKNIYFNHPNWQGNYKGVMELIDGKQRLNAVHKYLNNEIKAFGYYHKEYEDKLRITNTNFIFNVTTLKTRREILQLYLNINGGIAHSDEELLRVKRMLKNES